MKFNIHKSIQSHIYIILLLDAAAIIGSILLSVSIRYNTFPTQEAYVFIAEVMVIKLLFFWRCNLYKGMWRYTSIFDIVNIIKANIGATLIILVLFYGFKLDHTLSSKLFIPDMFISISLITFIRMFIRLYFEKNIGYFFTNRIITDLNAKNILIIGANDISEKFIRELNDADVREKYNLIGVIDDDKYKTNKTIHGFRVLGTTENLHSIVHKYEIDEVFIAMRDTTGKEIRTLIERCTHTGKPYRIIDSIDSLLTKQSLANRLRKVTYEDLIKRDPLEIDEASVGKKFLKSVIFVTGAAGSIGSELCRQLIKYNPRALILCDINESGLFLLSHELSGGMYRSTKITITLCDISNIQEVEKYIAYHKPTIMFHAAAYKHVHIMESHADQAVKTNVIGTKNMLELTKNYNIKNFILVSTDKSVNPKGVMGASKKIAEHLVTLYSHMSDDTVFTTVRFGNVIGSSGSVIPLFQKQIELGLPITLTSRKMTRFFMSIPEASKLILQATTLSHACDTYILDMGKPIKIIDLIEDLLRLNGIKSYDIKIKNIGLRPGEKIEEQLTHATEKISKSLHKKIFQITDSHKKPMSRTHAKKLLQSYNRIIKLKKNAENTMKELLLLFYKK